MAPFALVDEVKLVAVGDHVRLDGGRGGDPVPGWVRGSRVGGGAVRGADADVGVCPEAGAGVLDGGVTGRGCLVNSNFQRGIS